MKRKRWIHLVLMLAAILLGLASRKYSGRLPAFLADNAGDALWAMMVYFGFRFLLVHKSIWAALFLSLLFSFGIEFSQLYQSEWINEIRGTLLGGLILGHGFLAVDLVRYAAGIAAGVVVDWLVGAFFKHPA